MATTDGGKYITKRRSRGPWHLSTNLTADRRQQGAPASRRMRRNVTGSEAMCWRQKNERRRIHSPAELA